MAITTVWLWLFQEPTERMRQDLEELTSIANSDDHMQVPDDFKKLGPQDVPIFKLVYPRPAA